MHGIVRLEDPGQSEQHEGWQTKVKAFASRYRWFLGLVIAPTLIAAFYLYVFASDQYEAKADFVVRQADAKAQSDSMGQLLGLEFGTSSTAKEAYLVSDYLLSHETVKRLRDENGLVAMFRHEFIDPLSRLWYSDPTPEQLLDYFEDQVHIVQDTETGISHLTVHAFTPQDAYEIGRKMLLLGEERINELNERTYRDQVAHSQRELRAAEEDLARVENRMTAFRREVDDIDPTGSGSAQIGLVSELTGELTAARARLQAMEGAISHDSPQYLAMRSQVNALEAQVANQSQRIAGSNSSIASRLGNYENLVVRREASAKRYGAAAAEFERAKAEAERKQIYLIRVVDVNNPVKALYPKRGKIVLIILLTLTFAYAIGSMVFAGLREHHI